MTPRTGLRVRLASATERQYHWGTVTATRAGQFRVSWDSEPRGLRDHQRGGRYWYSDRALDALRAGLPRE